jgi:hypothetical protein
MANLELRNSGENNLRNSAIIHSASTFGGFSRSVASINLINKAMLNVDAARIGAGQIALKLFEWLGAGLRHRNRRHLPSKEKRALINNSLDFVTMSWRLLIQLGYFRIDRSSEVTHGCVT